MTLKKIPLRFSSLRRGPAVRALGRWLPLALLVLVLSAGAFAFYVLSIAWFKYEFSRAVAQLTRKEASRAAQTILDSLPPSLASRSITPQEETQALSFLSTLIRQNQNIVAAIVTDASGRVALISATPGAASGTTLEDLGRAGRSYRGFDEQVLLNELAAVHPNLEPVRVYITRNSQPVGWLTLLVDRTISRDAVEVAAARMTNRLTLLLGVLAIFAALAALLVRRQQRIARRLMERRSEVERLAYVGTLAAGLAHEIRNPLNALAMQLELLEEDVGDGAPQLVAPRLQNIRKGLAGVERTVHDFLNYATPGKQQPAMIDLAGQIGPMCDEITHRQADPPATLECLVPPGLMAWCDPHALRQILGNLLSNAQRAQRHRPEGARIRIEASRASHQWVDIAVDDAGPGVPDEQGERVFDCFFTTKSEGTGLGLPIARRLAEMNGGKLTLDPERAPLGGARFRLRLSARPRTQSED